MDTIKPETLGPSQPLDSNLHALASRPKAAVTAYGVEWAGWCAASAINEIDRLRAALIPLANAHTPIERECLTDEDCERAQAALYGTDAARAALGEP